ncbi:MAG: hypothetical protein E7556_00860 [Ruminococcaceae bacterium]|nr:hypothetical protein [Oscillospiraceae bacterium]
MKRSLSMRAISIILAVIVIFGTFGVAAFAAEKELGGTYGYIVPTDKNLSAPKTSYTFYGNSTVLYFMLFSTGKENTFYTVEIFSSNDYNPENVVSSFTNAYGDKGTAPLALTWPFKANPSGTYYGRCYTSIIDGEDETIDTSTIYEFTIKLNRLGKEQVTLTGISNSKNGVVIKWNNLSTATKYRIYRKANNETSWTKLADVKAGTKSYTDKTVKSGVKYSYTVRAYDKLYKSLYDKKGLTTVFLSTPTLTQPKSSSDIYPVVKWSKVAGSQGYYIYRKGGSLNNSTTWKRIATIKNPSTVSYTDKTATSPDWQYTYTVRAYNGKYLSAYNTTGIDYNYATAPVLKSASAVNGGIKVTWLDTNNAAKKFYIYRKASGETKWTKIGSSKTTSYTDKNVTNGTTYTYTVRTATATNTSSYDKKGISTLYIQTPSLSKISIAKNGDITIKWTSVKGVKGYNVYKSVNGSKWQKIASIKDSKTLTYKDTSAKKSGEKYTYTVRAVKGSYSSYYVTKGISSMYLKTPTVTAKNEYTVEQGSSVKVSWNSIAGAKSYKIFRKSSTDKSWSVLADNYTDKVYYDKTAESGVKYYYTVKAKNGSYSSGYTSTSLLTVLATPILKDAILTDTGVKITWDAVGGATNYIIFRRTLSGAWENIGTSKTTEYIDSTENSLTTPYIYTVRAVSGDLKSNYMINGVKNYVSVDSVDAIFENNVEADTAFVNLTWVASDSDSYEIYRSDNGSAPVLITTVSAADAQNFIDDEIVRGANHIYTIKPIKENKLSISIDSETIKWDFPPVPVVKVLAVPAYANTENPDRIEIFWEAVETAETYDIYRRTEDTDWVYLATVDKDSELTYVDIDVVADLTYYYSVKGVASDRDSLFDNIGTEAMLNGPVEEIQDMFVQLTDSPSGNGKKQVTLAWAPNEKASLYKVMRKTGPDGEWEFMGLFLSCDVLVFTDDTIEEGVTYTYTVHTYAPDRPSINNLVGKEICWSDGGTEEDTTVPDTTVPDTSEPESTVPDTTVPDSSEPESTVPDTTIPETTLPTTKPEESTDDGSLDIPDA